MEWDFGGVWRPNAMNGEDLVGGTPMLVLGF